ncbi:MAG: hypothetical protein FJ387_13905 [Verrucomicrobia bacterium]|nr:hypothetical protein [Verrucomicrobiota bacterium]
MRLASWVLPALVQPGQRVQSQVTWATVSGNPNAMVYVTVLADWSPEKPLAQLYQGLQGRPGAQFDRSFEFQAPTEPGTYRLRWIAAQAFRPVTRFFGKPHGGASDPGLGYWAELPLRVGGEPEPADRPAPSGLEVRPVLGGGPSGGSESWYAGTWDSTLYASTPTYNLQGGSSRLPGHPKTVGVRIEVSDANTRLPLAGVEVRLRGHYTSEWIGRRDDAPHLPAAQEHEFDLRAVTGADGVVVFGLSWQKQWPWSLGRPQVPNRGGWTWAEGWAKPVDDVEKVQRLDLSKTRYRGLELEWNLKHLLDFGQVPNTEEQDRGLVQRCLQVWEEEMRLVSARYCVLELGESFGDYGNIQSRAREFFERIRGREFGVVYRQVPNLTGLSSATHSGPYFVYLIKLSLEPLATPIDLNRASTGPGPDAQTSVPSPVVAGAPLPDALGATLEGLKEGMKRLAQNPSDLPRFLQEASALKRDLGLSALRSVPVVDPASGTVVPLDQLAKRMAQESGLSGQLAEDPLGTAYMAMVDSDYLFESAKIIPTPSGELLTPKEALDRGKRNPGVLGEAATAAEAALNLRAAYQKGDVQGFLAASSVFAGALGKASTRLTAGQGTAGQLGAVGPRGGARVAQPANYPSRPMRRAMSGCVP